MNLNYPGIVVRCYSELHTVPQEYKIHQMFGTIVNHNVVVVTVARCFTENEIDMSRLSRLIGERVHQTVVQG